MTARRLRWKNTTDVTRFLYVPLPIATVSFVGSGSDRVVVEGRDSPSFAANHRSVASCRFLSQIVVIGRWSAICDTRRKNFALCRPEAMSPFPYLLEGSLCE